MVLRHPKKVLLSRSVARSVNFKGDNTKDLIDGDPRDGIGVEEVSGMPECAEFGVEIFVKRLNVTVATSDFTEVVIRKFKLTCDHNQSL